MAGWRLYIVCGLPFAGKSTLARELARQSGCAVVDIDAINAARGVGGDGRPIAPAEWDASYAESYRQTAAALVAGRAVAYVGHAWTRGQRDRLRRIAAEYGAAALVIEVAVSEDEVRRRWLANRQRPARHDVRDDDFALALTLHEPVAADERSAHYDGLVPLARWVRALLADDMTDER